MLAKLCYGLISREFELVGKLLACFVDTKNYVSADKYWSELLLLAGNDKASDEAILKWCKDKIHGCLIRGQLDAKRLWQQRLDKLYSKSKTLQPPAQDRG